jgi:tRNA threonylcarbamoyladenosine biosynthesis protein TsaE
MIVDLESSSPEETARIGEALGRIAPDGLFLGLIGTLGAGKTAFVRGLARGAGVPESARVSSPTFGIVHTYSGGRMPVHHADLYRVRDAAELYDSGFYDLIGSAGMLVVEWLDQVPECAPEERLEIRFARLDDSRRRLQLIPFGAQATTLAASLRSDVAPHANP